MKKISLLLLFPLIFLLFSKPILSKAVYGAQLPEILGEAGMLIDVKTGYILFEKNPHKKLFPASITKVLTAIISLENAKLDDIVAIGNNPPLVDGTRIYLEKGEQLTLKQLLYALMLQSANDAAVAIAEHISGSVPDFARLMNKKAMELGCLDSNFTNPHGLTDENHYTSAYDMALIAQYALKNPVFAEIIHTKSYTIPNMNDKNGRSLINANKLLRMYKGADGVKTGYTTAAGQTIIASATQNNRQLLAVVLKTQGTAVWDDPIKLLNFGFDNFNFKNIIEPKKVITTIKVRYGKSIPLIAESGFDWVIPKEEDTSDIREEIILNPNITAPVKKGERLGKIIYSSGDKYIGEVGLLAQYGVKRYIYTRWWFWILAVYIPFRIRVQIKRSRRGRYKYNAYISVQRWNRKK